MISDLNTYLNKAVPDTRLTIKKYLDAKFEYLVGEVMIHFIEFLHIYASIEYRCSSWVLTVTFSLKILDETP